MPSVAVGRALFAAPASRTGPGRLRQRPAVRAVGPPDLRLSAEGLAPLMRRRLFKRFIHWRAFWPELLQCYNRVRPWTRRTHRSAVMSGGMGSGGDVNDQEPHTSLVMSVVRI